METRGNIIYTKDDESGYWGFISSISYDNDNGPQYRLNVSPNEALVFYQEELAKATAELLRWGKRCYVF